MSAPSATTGADHIVRRGHDHTPKLKGMRFTATIIERYRRHKTSVGEAMIEMYPAGVSTRRIEDDSEIL